MKNKLFNLLLLVLGVCGFASCDNPESYVEHKGVFRSVFEVERGRKAIPVLFKTDTFVIKNLNNLGLTDGDRAYMDVKYVYNPFAMSAPDMEVINLYAKVQHLPLTSREAAADAEFRLLHNSPIMNDDVLLQTISGDIDYGCAWAESDRQYFVVNYSKNDYGSFKLALDSVSYLGGMLHFRLYSQLEPADGRIDPYVFPSEFINPQERVSKILSFEIDWNKLQNEFTPEERERATKEEYIRTSIAYVDKNCDKVDGLYVPKKEKVLTNFGFKNPWYVRTE